MGEQQGAAGEADEVAARWAALRILGGDPFLPGLSAEALERAPGRRGGDRRHGPWVELVLPGAVARVTLGTARVLAFARAGLVPPRGDQAPGRPRLPRAALLQRADAALARWQAPWTAEGLVERGPRRARALFRSARGEEAELLLDAHTGVVLALTIERPLRPASGRFPIGRGEARRLAACEQARLRGHGLEVPELPVVLHDPRTGEARAAWRCGTWVEHHGWPCLPCAWPGDRVWLLVDAVSGAVVEERAA